MTDTANELDDDERAGMERNVRLYPWYQAVLGTMPWLPVFFLFFIQFIPLDQVVKLSAIYYLAVVCSEVPSGYFSDRFGRRLTLLISAVSLLIAYTLFVLSSSFSGLLIADIFLAAGIAFKSGSDTSLLHDSLVRLGRESEYAEQEARAKQYGMAAAAVACLVGGFSGVLDLSIPYIISVVVAIVTIALCLRLREPMMPGGRTEEGFVQQVVSCLGYLRIPLLFWLMCFYVIGYCLQHVLYEFYQPYIQLLDLSFLHADESITRSSDTPGIAPAASGVVVGLSMFVGVLGARFGMPLFRALGLTRLLMIALGFQTVVIGLLGVLLQPIVLLLLVSRNFSMAMVHGPLMGAIAPLVESRRRATFLSIQSLAARLGFSLWLFLLSQLLTPHQVLDWPALSSMLIVCALAGLFFCIAMSISAKWVKGAA